MVVLLGATNLTPVGALTGFATVRLTAVWPTTQVVQSSALLRKTLGS